MDKTVDKQDNDERAVLRYHGEAAAVVTAGMHVEPVDDNFAIEPELSAGGVNAALCLIHRIFKIVEPDPQRPVADVLAVDRLAGCHGEGLADLDRRFPDATAGDIDRSEERRVGKECVRTCRSRWSPEH